MSLPLIVFLIVFVLIFLLRMQIPLGLMTACMFYFIVAGTPIKMVGQQTLKTFYTNYTIIAVPLFIFAANVMNTGKVTDKIYGFALGLVGRFKGGLGHVNILGSLVFAGMTGSAIADASGLGKMEIEHMKKEGYDAGFSCAMTASSAVLGPTFPPSIPMVIYAMYSGVSVGALFLGGMIPALLLTAALMIYVAIIAQRRNYPTSVRMGFRKFLRSTFAAIPALLTPVVLLAGIYTGVMTPTEAGAVAGFYALVVAAVVYRMLGWQDLKNILKETVKGVGTVSLMIGAAACINYIVAVEQVSVNAANLITGLTQNKYLFLFIVNVAILILGMFIDTSVIQMVFVPLMIPIATALGIDLLHFGLVAIFNMMIGLCTPPFGMLLFITSGISATPLKDIVKEIWWPLAAMIAVLAIISYMPDVVLFLPRVFLHYGA
ncbi:MAG: TRAP transporter large permease [Clostridiales bacterium]|jgi:tripartite ATP-independent transporter DctM subunit|nr:TRAP transporter large permease [Clostridiales bacterium]OPZ70035.1 MAG: Sialic acid TRAP transporter permease protein SiaT [Firmicutes bacterium ADurb.Bin467]